MLGIDVKDLIDSALDKKNRYDSILVLALPKTSDGRRQINEMDFVPIIWGVSAT